MRSLVVGLGLIFASTSFAANAPKGNGNFRRGEVVQIAGANGKTARVVGLATVKGHVDAPSNYKSSRILLVQNGNKVSYVKAPTDKSKDVVALSDTQAKRLGLLTQKQAAKLASQNAGKYGFKGKVKLAYAGLGAGGSSFEFKQVSPTGKTIKQWGGLYRVDHITRTVTVKGMESASARETKIADLTK